MYISSADMMTRNTSRRVEIACPVYDKAIQQQILQQLQTMLYDNVKGRTLGSDGSYYKRDSTDLAPLDSQLTFIQQLTVNKYSLLP